MNKIEYRKRILRELEEMLGDQISECLEIDESAKQIYDKFINPLADYNELLIEQIKEKTDAPF